MSNTARTRELEEKLAYTYGYEAGLHGDEQMAPPEGVEGFQKKAFAEGKAAGKAEAAALSGGGISAKHIEELPGAYGGYGS